MKVVLIAEARIKTDAIDAHALARLERTGFLTRRISPRGMYGTNGRSFGTDSPWWGYLSAISFLDQEIKKITHEIKASLRDDPRAELPMTIPGTGHLTAHLLLSEIGDIHRFASAKKLSSCAGLLPSLSQSARHRWHGSITKQGNSCLRWATVEAAQKDMTGDPRLALFYRKLKKEEGSAKARVAVARKLLVAVYHALKY